MSNGQIILLIMYNYCNVDRYFTTHMSKNNTATPLRGADTTMLNVLVVNRTPWKYQSNNLCDGLLRCQ